MFGGYCVYFEHPTEGELEVWAELYDDAFVDNDGVLRKLPEFWQHYAENYYGESVEFTSEQLKQINKMLINRYMIQNEVSWPGGQYVSW